MGYNRPMDGPTPPARPQPNAPPPPGAWPRAHALARRVLAPVERFLHVEAASGIVLVVAAVVALVWANSPWADSYAALWHTPLGFHLGGWSFERDLHFWINDGLMAVFFFVVGLEIRREAHRGVLSDLRRAALPLAAAIGGMLVPAALFLALNAGRPSAGGWGVPMATDIAFAVGVLALLGRRVPPALRVMLLALAVIDDLGAILVIAFFYTASLDPMGLAVAAAGLAVIVIMRGLGVRRAFAYLLPALVVWAGIYQLGVHPTLAGVILGLMTPVVAYDEGGEPISPAERLQYAFHGWVAFAIMPLFALANAGVPLGEAGLDADTVPAALGVILGLALGKPIGVMVVSWACVRMGLAVLPAGIGWRHVLVVGMVAGIGFTMALFIAGLAFPAGRLLEATKLAILVASAVAAVAGLLIGRALLRPIADADTTEGEAEAGSGT